MREPSRRRPDPSKSLFQGALFLAAAMLSAAAGAGTDVKVNGVTPADLNNDQHEVDIAVDPGNSSRLVCAYIDWPRGSLGISASADGGATWTDTQIQSGCDATDNDGDGFVDEELCNGLDDDLPPDGLVDEDLCCSLTHIDPAVVADASGDFYAIGIAYDPNATSFVGSSYVTVHTSPNGGLTWTELPSPDQSAYTPGGPNVHFLDKTWIAVDRTGFTYNDRVYAAWQRDTPNVNADTHVRVSLWDPNPPPPAQPAWTTPVQVDDVPPGQCDGFDADFDGKVDEELCNSLDDDLPPDGLVDEDLCCSCAEAPYPDVGADGRLWVLWRQNAKFCGQPARFHVDVSFDGGATFGPDRAGVTYQQIPDTPPNHTFRVGSFPMLKIHPFNPVVLFVVYAEDPPGADPADVMFTWSSDGGVSWMPPVRVNDDPTNTPQYMASLTVKGSNGAAFVDIAWVDERNSIGCDYVDNDGDFFVDEERPNGLDDDGDLLVDEDVCDLRMDVYWARSVDQGGWATFSTNARISDVSSVHPPSNFMGDYIGIDSDLQNDFIAWADTRTNAQGDIYFDLQPDMDSDGDGVLDLGDCSPSDPNLWGIVAEVQNVAADKVSGSTDVSLSWASQDSSTGPATRYDLVTGLLSDLRLDKDYQDASCLADNHPDSPYTDTRGNPPAADGHYVLVRAQGCGTSSYGDSSLTPDPRDGLEDGFASLPDPDPCP